MDTQEITQLCVESCRKYYEYLVNNGRGVDEISIISKNKIENSDLWKLRLGGRIFNSDAINIKNLRYNILYDARHFSIESYDLDKNILIILIKPGIVNFEEASPDELVII